jgi:hypothetical protein
MRRARRAAEVLVLGVLAAAAGTARGDGPPAPAAPAAPAAAAAPRVLDDFGGDPADRWTARGLSMSETSVEAGSTPSSGGVLEVGLEGKSGSIERTLEPADWRDVEALSLFVAVEAKAPQPLRVVVLGGKPARGLLRRFTAAPGPWREVVLPLRDFREDGGDFVGSFARVDRVRIQWDEGGGKVRLDDLRLRPGARGPASSRRTEDDLLRLAFPGGGGGVSFSERFLLVTDVPALAGERGKPLLARLEEGARVLAERFAVAGTLEERVPLHVFRSEADQKAFVARMADHFGARVGAPEADGFTVFGVPSSSWDPKQGWDRPVYVHESVHGLVVRLLSISSNGNWVQEGLASAVQARVHPRSVASVDLGKAFERLAAKEKGLFVPWKDLLFERRPPTRAYAQLASVCEFLADRAGKDLGKVWAALSASPKPLHEGGIALVAGALGAEVPALEAEWLAWGRAARKR